MAGKAFIYKTAIYREHRKLGKAEIAAVQAIDVSKTLLLSSYLYYYSVQREYVKM